MSKFIGNEKISRKKKVEMIDDLERYMECHDALVSLYDLFNSNPTLNKYFNIAYSEAILNSNTNIAKNIEDDFPRVHCMKKAIELMADDLNEKKHINTQELEYEVILNDVSERFQIDIDTLDYVASNFDKFIRK